MVLEWKNNKAISRLRNWNAHRGLYLFFILLNGLLLFSGKESRAQNQKYDVAAYYFPGFHDDQRIEFLYPDGKGEWQTVYNAKTKDSIERQSRVLLWGYQDETDPEVMDEYINAAISHGVNTFIFDWYWYEDKPFLESCLDSGFLKANHNRMKFYLMWANHDWVSYVDPSMVDKSKLYWSGKVDTTIFHHIVSYVIHKYFKRPSYYKIKGQPVFSLYELSNFIDGIGGPENAKKALDYFRSKTKEAGFPGLYLQAVLWSAFPSKLPEVSSEINSLGKVMEYFGFDSFTNYTWTHVAFPGGDYDAWANQALSHWGEYAQFPIPYDPQVSIGWDNNPRYPASVKTPYIVNPTPEKFKKYLLKAKEYLNNHPE